MMGFDSVPRRCKPFAKKAVLPDTGSCPRVLSAYKETSMGPDGYLVLLIGVGGTIAGAAATILVSRLKAPQKKGRSHLQHKTETVSVLGEAIDVRELRILRSLIEEPNGRRLGAFKDKYYRPFLEDTINRGWVKQVDNRYFLTPKGSGFCRAYLQQLLRDWKATDEA
jgi:hypothetical protein